MNFQIHALPAAPFEALFALADADLAAHGARRVTADAKPGYPCRVSLLDAEPGERLILVNHEHLAAESPFRSRHAVFVREGAEQARPEPGEIPEQLDRRALAVRAFSAAHDMLAAEIAEPGRLAGVMERLLADPAAACLHLHSPARGCYFARAERAR
ncbi:DUF1203 domain-containing protein [Marinicauda algicola]|uniref:DUF1203 domain-containing protein n=1 Tax=Marinicauda algicola TaxID=2029849 RepID=A0A4V6RF59_9PROT|nr:DUF1203 domain-containing protein [Marinicauda algicola]TGY90029.1 DUF1203 domain-containing protein [Marinicauda algicola]